MANGTEPAVEDVVAAWTQITVGIAVAAVSGVTNILIFLSIAKYQALKDDKEYLLLLALALADAIHMVAHVAVRVLDICTRVLGYSMHLSTRICMFMPHIPLFMMGWPLSNIMLLVISFDRLLLVVKPVYYIQLGVGYVKWVAGINYGLAIGSTAMLMVYVWTLGNEVRYCIGMYLVEEADGIFRLSKAYYTQTSMAAAMLSVVVYVAVWVIYFSGRGKVLPQDNQSQITIKIKRQRKMTITLGISCMCTVALYIIPANVASSFIVDGLPTIVNLFMWIVALSNSLANIFIYQFRHGIAGGTQWPPA